MPILTRDTLAVKFRQNWIAKNPLDVTRDGLDDSLTSLGWLQNLNIMNIGGVGTPPASPQPHVESDLKVNPNNILNYAPPIQIKQEPGTWPIQSPSLASIEAIDYKTNPYVKPPYSYATLICMAMKETRKSKITLASIYNWITDNFMYYRVADPSWQNSIRHNLSLNKCFQKVPRRKDEPGKGGFWCINPEYSDLLENGVLKKRRASTRDTSNGGPSKKIKKENDEPLSPCTHGNKSKHVDKIDFALSGVDFSWNTILEQDIDVDGFKIKTEDILNHSAHLPASPLMAMSPPCSEHSVDSLDDILNDLDNNSPPSNSSSDVMSDDLLNLSVQGIKIEAPDWWSESLNGSIRDSTNLALSGLNTPLAPSPVPHNDNIAHPWQESQIDIDAAIAAFDVENLFDNIPSPALSS